MQGRGSGPGLQGEIRAYPAGGRHDRCPSLRSASVAGLTDRGRSRVLSEPLSVWGTGAVVAAVSRGGRKSQERGVTRGLRVPRAGVGSRGGVGPRGGVWGSPERGGVPRGGARGKGEVNSSKLY